MSEGWVYIFSNPGLPKVVKVGYTLKHPSERAKELSHSGVPRPYVIEYAVRVDHPHKGEKRVHRQLANEGLNDGKEWFRCSADHAIAAVLDQSEEIYQELTTKEARNTEAIAAKKRAAWVRTLERTMGEVYMAVHRRQWTDYSAVYKPHEAIRARHTPQSSWWLMYLTVCLIGGALWWSFFEEPFLLSLLMLLVGPYIAHVLYDHRTKRLKAKFETTALSDQLRASERRDLDRLDKRFPDMSDSISVYVARKVEADEDPPFMRPLPQEDVARLSLQLTSSQDERLDGDVTNHIAERVVTCIEVGFSGARKSVVIPLVCFPGETKSIPTLSWRHQPERWMWSIQRAWGYAVDTKKGG